jgi:hypothetical protein
MRDHQRHSRDGLTFGKRAVQAVEKACQCYTPILAEYGRGPCPAESRQAPRLSEGPKVRSLRYSTYFRSVICTTFTITRATASSR